MQANLRDKWPNEALNFTPWLAENLDVLGDAVGLKLELVHQEQQVGSFSLDILAREANEDVTVVIENQLEWTDHSHLGQLLTYAAGCEAQIAIWVADEFQHEHAESLHRLNEWAGANIRFYGVKVDVIRDGDTLQPTLRAVVCPGAWNKELTLSQPPPPTPEAQRHLRFFEPIIAEMLRSGFSASHRQAWSYNARFFPSGFDGDIGYTVSFEGRNSAWVYFLIRTWDSIDLSNALFDALKTEQQRIESSVDAQAEWLWNRFDSYSFATICVRADGLIDDSPERLEATRAWMLDLLPKFKDAFEERTERLLAELRRPETTQTTGEQ